MGKARTPSSRVTSNTFGYISGKTLWPIFPTLPLKGFCHQKDGKITETRVSSFWIGLCKNGSFIHQDSEEPSTVSRTVADSNKVGEKWGIQSSTAPVLTSNIKQMK